MRARLRYRNSSVEGSEWLPFTVLALFLTAIAAFLRHCWWTLTLFMSDAPLTAGKAGIAILGIVMPPLGALHGVWLWFH